MKDSNDFYTKKAYPFQDGVLRLMKTLQTPFFLTGGTALARGYLGHRYSDDLDFFVNDDDGFSEHARRVEESLLAGEDRFGWRIDRGGAVRADRFVSLSMLSGDVLLKIGFVNDIAFRVGSVVEHSERGRLDTIENILANKISALFRYAEKEVADIWAIWKRYDISWVEVLENAGRKEATMDSVSAAEIIASFPADRFENIRWSRSVDRSLFLDDLKTIAHEILGVPQDYRPEQEG